MRILVTGASGYLGSRLVKYLSGKHQVTALIRSSSSKERLSGLSVEVRTADNYDQLCLVFEQVKPEIVINTVALYGRKGEKQSDLVAANITYPVQLLELSEEYSARALIHTGTSLTDGVSLYSLTKNTFVKIANASALNGAKFINIELEHFYGPGDDSTKFLSYVAQECNANRDLDLTEGTQERDFIYIDDVLSAYETIIENIDALNNKESFPLGTGEAPTVKSVVETIHKACGSSSKLNFGAVPMRDKELRVSKANTLKLKALGWQPSLLIVAGLKKMLTEEKALE